MIFLYCLLISTAWAQKDKGILIPGPKLPDGGEAAFSFADINELKAAVYGFILFVVVKEVWSIAKNVIWNKSDKLDHIEKLLITHIAQNDKRMEHMEDTVSEIKQDIKDIEAKL